MMGNYQTIYRQLAGAAPDEFQMLLSEPDCKSAIYLLVGDQVPVDELGLNSNVIAKLKRSGIRTVDALLREYEISWSTSSSYLSEVTHKLEGYIRNLLILLVVPEPEEISVPLAEEDTPVHIEEEKPQDKPIPSAETALAYYMEQDEPIEKLNLSTRSFNALKRSGIHTLSQLLSCTAEEMDKMRNLGAKSKAEIQETLLAFLEARETAAEETAQDESETPEPADVRVFGKGSELFADAMYRENVVRFFEKRELYLENFLLSTRSSNALLRNGINTFSALLRIFPNQVADLKNLGVKSLQEINEFVERILDQYTVQLSEWLNSGDEEVPFFDYEIQKMLLSMYDSSTGFYGYSFKEFREELPESVTDDEIRAGVSALLQKREIEYVDFRCYRIYPGFYDHLASCKELNDDLRAVLLDRLHGLSLQQIADKQSLTRERVRQKESKALRTIRQNNNDGLFDEDYYRYLYENYAIPKTVWLNELGCSEDLLGYLSVFCESRGKANPEAALEDPQVSVNLKYRLQKLFEKTMLVVNGEQVEYQRLRFERAVLKHYCSDEKTFEEFVGIYNRALKSNKLPEDHKFYITDENKKSRGSNLSSLPYVLWKQGERLRYYDAEKYDFSELLETISLGQFQNTELSAKKFMQEYPALMEKYDIRDEYELHCILKKIVDPDTCHEISFPRQPIIRFGNCDRKEIVLAVITELSPVSTADLVAELQTRFGYSEEMIRANCITEFSDLYHKGYYTVDFKRMSGEKQALFRAALTEPFYTFDELKAIYREMFPAGDLQEINPQMMKQMGFVVNSSYVVQHYKTAEEYITHVLTKDDIVDLKVVRERFEICRNTLYAVLHKLCEEHEIFYYDPDSLLHFRRLSKMGITKEMLRDFCESASGLISDGQFFTIHMLRKNGFTHPLDDLGLDDYFYNALLGTSPAVSDFSCFGGLALCKVKQEHWPARVDFVASLLCGKTSISVGEIRRIMRIEYGVQMQKDKDRYKLTEFITAASEKLGMYFDRTMEKVYRDKSYYYEDLEKMETEEYP